MLFFEKLVWCHVVKGLMREIRIVSINPLVDSNFKIERVIPFVAPNNIFFNDAHDPLGIRVAFGVAPSGKDLLEPQNRAGLHEALGSGLTAVV